MPTESETRKQIIDRRLRQAGWDVSDRTQVIEEFFVSIAKDNESKTRPVGESTVPSFREFSDYVLLGKNGKPLARGIV
jgi:type I restriction enzyme, R subunit